MKLYRTKLGCVAEEGGKRFSLDGVEWDELMAQDDLAGYLHERIVAAKESGPIADVLPPIAGQEVWAAGVTYYRSRGARMEESKDAGGGNFYDRVYSAERPELFFKSTASRTVGAGGNVRI